MALLVTQCSLVSFACIVGEPEIVWVPDANAFATPALDAELPEDRAVTVGEALVLRASFLSYFRRTFRKRAPAAF